MPITHEQAHKLIQLDLDKALSLQETAALSAHLHQCSGCQSYANEMKAVEDLLSRVMKQQWKLRPAPLSAAALTEKGRMVQASTILAIRKAAISLIVVVFVFSAWQVALSGAFSRNSVSQIPFSVAPVPTPSSLIAQSTRTETTRQDCQMMLYPIATGDTLAGIAERFSVSEEEVIEINHLTAQTLPSTGELILPVCSSTPTGTVHPATFTTTFTPLSGLTSSPDG